MKKYVYLVQRGFLCNSRFSFETVYVFSTYKKAFNLLSGYINEPLVVEELTEDTQETEFRRITFIDPQGEQGRYIITKLQVI